MNLDPVSQKQSFALKRITWFGMIVNMILVIIKLLAGVFSYSQVLIADAVHSLSDLSTDLAVLIGVRYWEQPADEDHPHGHAKIETLVTLFIGFVLLLVALKLIPSAIFSINELIQGKERATPGFFALWAALFSIFIKEVLYQTTRKVGLQLKSSALVANAWHHRSDAISSIPAAATVILCLIFGNEYVFLDPVGTMVVSCMILYTAVEIMRPTFSTLLDRGLSKEKIALIQLIVREYPQIQSVHKIRTRPLGEQKYAVEFHIQVDPQMTVFNAHSLSHEIQSSLCQRIEEIVEVVAHIEPSNQDNNQNISSN
ncbi:MAG: cation diffusion facilitator family transporter [Planctomycetia bacterium]|nr:cation diffusion facilitator family transporter [Planctomycetia bacterium]